MGLRELSPLTASPRKEGYTPPQHAPPSKKMLTFCSCGREKVRIFLVHFGNFFPSCACMCAHTHTFSLCMLTHPLTEKETAILPRGSVFPHHGPPSSSPSQAVCPPLTPAHPRLLLYLSGKCVAGRGTLSWNSNLTSLLHSPRGFSDCVQVWVQGAWLGLRSD